MTRVQKCRALRRRGMSVVEAEKSLARHAAWLILYPAAVQPCSLTDFACTVESFALAVCPHAFIVLSLLSSACCLRRTHRYPHGPRPSSSSCSTKELGGLHAGNQQSEISFVQYYLYVLYHSRPAVANVAALARRLACSELLLLRGCWKPNNVGTWARGQMLTPV
jgi:hypothetical protein